MITCENLSLEILDINQYVISWENVGDVNNDDLIIQRSEDPESKFKDIGTINDTIETYVDTSPPTYKKYIPFYYRIKQPDGSYSLTVHLPLSPDKHLLQYNRMLLRYLQRDVGYKSYYFHFMRTGIRCDCWDKQLKKSVVKDCLDCGGTGFKVGYADPIEIYISYPQESPTEVSVGGTKFTIASPQAWAGNYPLIYPEDVIVRDWDKEVFKVGDKVNRTGRRMYPARQFLGLRAIEHGSIEYSLIEKI